MKPSPPPDEHLLLVDSFENSDFFSSSSSSSLSLPSLVDESSKSVYNYGKEEVTMVDTFPVPSIDPFVAADRDDMDSEILIRLLPLDTNFTSFVEVLVDSIILIVVSTLMLTCRLDFSVEETLNCMWKLKSKAVDLCW